MPYLSVWIRCLPPLPVALTKMSTHLVQPQFITHICDQCQTICHNAALTHLSRQRSSEDPRSSPDHGAPCLSPSNSQGLCSQRVCGWNALQIKEQAWLKLQPWKTKPTWLMFKAAICSFSTIELELKNHFYSSLTRIRENGNPAIDAVTPAGLL